MTSRVAAPGDQMSEDNVDKGAGRITYQWLVGILVIALFSLMGTVMGAFNARLSYIESNGSPPVRETLARHDADLRYLRESMSEFRGNQEKIMMLLSQLLDESRAGSKRNSPGSHQ